jgi:hypothetical protein
MVHMASTDPAPAPSPADFPEVLTTAMAAELLHIHVEHLRRLVRPVDVYRPGTRTRLIRA